MGRKVGEKGAGVFTSSCLVLCLSGSGYVFYETILEGSITYVKLWRWFDSDLLLVYFGLQFDSLGAGMLLVVAVVSTLVHVFSIAYMEGDPHIPRFMALLSFFTFLMFILVSSDNLLQLFIGWEGVGLCSYLLISFWLTRLEANRAAIKAMLVNRIGDVGLILAAFIFLEVYGTLEFSSLFAIPLSSYQISFICLLLVFGAMGKSAQLGLHTWLPDAMEGEKALFMVTAGVYLLIRCSPFLEQAPVVLVGITVLGSLTIFVAATSGVVQSDLKKVIAYSTCSQLGYMVLACGISSYSISLFHLMNHAFFKALLFLGAGALIHALSNEQDIRKMGGLLLPLPLIYSVMLIGSSSLMGLPYLTGFYSKDLILELVLEQYYTTFAYWLGCFSVFLTAFYSVRLLYLVFLSGTNAQRGLVIKEGSWVLILPLVFLAIGSLFWGYLTKDIFWSFQTTISPSGSIIVKMLPTVLSLGGAVVVVIFFLKISTLSHWLFLGYTFFLSAWQFNFLFNYFFILKIMKTGVLFSYWTMDKGAVELLGPRGLSYFWVWMAQRLSHLQSGLVFNYVLVILLGVISLFLATL
uniref:NADH-ubiquinone oxidoreductase chain 5 n=1 Tax=Paraconotrochus antarcticus TaxID=2666516 RepID=A0A7T1S049_9CNID|nr:NADH dehydrogenase subunit 5 [Paraconotrochus antarcticus]QPO84673.1 NADH dehydrogenase subunit 5 [Paraconotrochus antarcticus]